MRRDEAAIRSAEVRVQPERLDVAARDVGPPRGRRPEHTGVYILSVSARSAVPDAVMLPQYFRQLGYFSGGAGKVFHNPAMNDPRSWDFYDDGPGADPQEQAAIKNRYGGGDGRPAWFPLDGDGSLLMNLGSLVTIGAAAPKNLVHFVCDNECYEANGGHPIPNQKVDYST